MSSHTMTALSSVDLHDLRKQLSSSPTKKPPLETSFNTYFKKPVTQFAVTATQTSIDRTASCPCPPEEVA
jgi:hypothetical protein